MTFGSMRVYRAIEVVQFDKNTALTLGTFDGVHLGHKSLLQALLGKSSGGNLRSFVVTFDPHPRSILHPDFPLQLLTPTEEKLELFEGAGVDSVLVLPFTKEISKMSSGEFFEEIILRQIGLSSLTVGYDFRFGKGRTGDAAMLSEYARRFDFQFEQLEAFQLNGKTVGSSLIRDFLSEGSMQDVNSHLGYRYSFGGEIVVGNKRGRTLGFPTANISVSGINKMLPGNGVYAALAELDGVIYKSVMNIGVRPTFQDKPVVVPEVHIVDFNKDIYGKKMKVYPLIKIRNEKKFSSIEELQQQILQDKEQAINLLQEFN